MARHVITNVRIFDGTGREPFPGEVLVDGSRIAAVTTGSPGPRASDARMIDGDGGTSSAGADVTVMTDAEVEAAMEIARPRNLRVCGHCRSAGSVLMALRHGVEVIYHATHADEEALDALEAARDRIFVGPAIG